MFVAVEVFLQSLAKFAQCIINNIWDFAVSNKFVICYCILVLFTNCVVDSRLFVM